MDAAERLLYGLRSGACPRSPTPLPRCNVCEAPNSHSISNHAYAKGTVPRPSPAHAPPMPCLCTAHAPPMHPPCPAHAPPMSRPCPAHALPIRSHGPHARCLRRAPAARVPISSPTTSTGSKTTSVTWRSSSMAKRNPLAVPELGSCATTGRARWLWAASTLPIGEGPLDASPLPQLLESATSKAADPADIWAV